MPIGTLDYVSTAAWNDPYNPWPLYSQVALSAADADLNVSGAPLIMQLVDFDPLAVGVQNWVYQSLDPTGPNGYISMVYNSGDNQVTIKNDNGDSYYACTTTVRSIPAGWLQGNTNWDAADIGADVTTLSIIPVTTWLNPWEYRRRRMLEIM